MGLGLVERRRGLLGEWRGKEGGRGRGGIGDVCEGGRIDRFVDGMWDGMGWDGY